MYKLTKPIIRGPEGKQKLFLSTSGTWITNGEWAIRRDLVDGGDLLVTQDTLKLKFGPLASEEDRSPDVEGFIGKVCTPDPEEFNRTWLIHSRPHWKGGGHSHAAVYKGEGGSIAFVFQLYADYFPSTLYGHPRERRSSDHDNGAWKGHFTNAENADSDYGLIVCPTTGPELERVNDCRRALGLPEYEPEGDES